MKKILNLIFIMTLMMNLFTLKVSATELESTDNSIETNNETTEQQPLLNVIDVTQEEMEEFLSKNDVVLYDSSWGDVDVDWSQIENPDDVYIDDTEDLEKKGTVAVKGNIHEDVMAKCSNILITTVDSEGNEATHGLSNLNAFRSTYNTKVGTYTVSKIELLEYDDEYVLDLKNDTFEVVENGVVEIVFSVSPKIEEVVEPVEVTPEVVDEKMNPILKTFIILGSVLLIGAIVLIVVKKKNDTIN